MKQKLSLVLSLLAIVLTTTPILTSCDAEPDYIKEIRKQEEAQKSADETTIQAYLKRRNITNFTRYESGIYLVNITDGPASNPLITAGKTVTTKYVGRFIDPFNDNQVFEASSDNRTPCGCFSFVNGQNGIIPGWSAATLNMREGDRKLILIPSYLAYGPQGNTSIPGNTPLLFDMEITNVE